MTLTDEAAGSAGQKVGIWWIYALKFCFTPLHVPSSMRCDAAYKHSYSTDVLHLISVMCLGLAVITAGLIALASSLPVLDDISYVGGNLLDADS